VWVGVESPMGGRGWVGEDRLSDEDGERQELGGGGSYKLTEQLYFDSKPRLVYGSRPVPEKELSIALAEIKVADETAIREKICGVKGR